MLVKALPTVLLQTTCFLAPLVMTFLLTFQRTRNFQLQWTWDLWTWTDIFSKPHYWTILGHTLFMGVACVAICLVIAFPVAYGLATRFKAIENEIKVLITFAFITDATLKTYRLGAVPRQERCRQLPPDGDRASRRTWSPSSIPTGRRCWAWSTIALGLRDLHHLSLDQQHRPLPDPRRL